MHNNKVCIIGAGSSGIAVCKVLKENGIPFDCFEKGSDIGGNWRYNNDNGMSSAYRSLHINTSRDVMAYSDFPMPRDYPAFPHHSQIIKYFEAYVEHFDLRTHIQFNTAIIEINRNENNTFTIKTDKGNTETYQYVIVANGHHWSPRYPEPAFAGNFEGETFHSHYYKTPDQIENKNILIVGIGNSAVDIACEAARLHTGKVYISTRSGAYIVPNYLMGIPFDTLASPLVSSLPMFLQRLILNTALWLARGKQETYGVPKPKRKLLSEHPTLSQDLLNLAGRGLIQIKPNIQEFNGKEVIFEDKTTIHVDTVIYATGYKIDFPFFKKDFFDTAKVAQNNDFQLYKRVVHPEVKNLFFVGLIQPLGAIMPLAEVQAIYIAKLINQEVALPTPEKMREDIEKTSQKIRKRYKASPRHTLQVDFYPYKKLLMREIKKMRTGKKKALSTTQPSTMTNP